jgi:hypothetical protein
MEDIINSHVDAAVETADDVMRVNVITTRPAILMHADGTYYIEENLTPQEIETALKSLAMAVVNMNRTEQKLRSTLEECAEQFDYYAKGHRKKEASAQTEDAALTAGGKATTNEALAYHIRDLLAETRRTPETITEVVV